MAEGASLRGKEAMVAKLRRFAAKFPNEVGRALYIETEIELKEVKRRTPVDTGELRASEHVVGPIIKRSSKGPVIYCMIVAGGPATPYAVYVHEDLDAFHKVGQAKFIESVLLESRPYMAMRVAKRIELNRALD